MGRAMHGCGSEGWGASEVRECDGEGGRVGDVESWRESGRRGGEGVIGEGRGGEGRGWDGGL